MKTKHLFFVVLLTIGSSAFAQKRELYFLQFDQKDYDISGVQIPVHKESREFRGIPTDSLDYPVRQSYVNILCSVEGVRLKFPLRWLNGVVVEVSERKDSVLFHEHEFVTSYRWLGAQESTLETSKMRVKDQTEKPQPSVSIGTVQARLNYGLASAQNKAIGIYGLHESNHLGQGVKIAVFDAGFLKADRLPAFAHLNDQMAETGQLVLALDLVDDEKDVWDDDDHGLHVLSCLAAWEPGRMIGTAPFANYYLFRTENAKSEYVIEEYYWMRAAEMADSMGIDIINSSLGYNEFDAMEMNYRQDMLNGKQSVIAKAAAIAVSKGMIVVNAAGNEGNKRWKKLITPSDAMGVISVGAVDIHGNSSSFSSMGPTADGRMKPDVVAQGSGVAIASSFGSYYQGNGTSYASPIIAGALACLKQKHPSLSPQMCMDLLHNSAHKNQSPDSLQGWGIPHMQVADFFAQQILELKQSAGLMQIPDTIHGKLQLALYNSRSSHFHCKISRKSRLMGLIPYHKKVLKKTYSFSDFNTFYLPLELSRYRDEGLHRLKIKIKEKDGHYLQYEKLFYNKLNP